MSAKVIAGFDGSDESRDALRLAKELAEAEDADLHVAVVLPRSYNPFEEAVAGGPLSEGLEADRFAEVERELGAGAFTKASLDGGLGGRSAARALHDYAEEQRASLIVVGSSRHGALGRALAGSVSESLLRGAPCGVAVASRGYAGKEARRGVIGVAYDGGQEADVALSEAESLARALGARMRVISVVPELAPVSVQGFDVSEIQASMQEAYQESLDKAVSRVADEVRVEPVLKEGEPAEILADQSGDLDLLVTGSRGYGSVKAAILGGVSSKVIRIASCPVLVTAQGGTS